jgi:myo-inositol 2-dehydrogenase/D-chiro-inositol 1-dehydrogenase
VWICSPSQFHADQIKECAAAGKHVFCEKPIATDLQGTYEAIAACKTADVKLMTALQRRFDPHFARVKSAIVNGEVGTPVQGRLCSRDPAPPPFDYVKGGGGIFKDMAIHDLDMARFLMGADPISVMATGSCQINDEILVLDDSAERMDTAAVLVKFPGDVVVTVEVCRQAPYGYDQRAEVLGTKGMIHTENLHPTTAKLSTAAGTGDADLPHDFFMSRYEVAYKDETAAFAKAVFADTAPPVTGDDGLMALAIALAAGKSAEENRWVEISEFVTVKDGSVVPV